MSDSNRHDEEPFMPSPESPEESQKSYRRYKWLLPAIAGVLVVLFAGFLLSRQQLFPPKPAEETPPSASSALAPGQPATPTPAGENPRFKITALADSAAGIAPDSAFRLDVPEGVTFSLVQKFLRVQPAFGFKLVQQGADMLLTPDQPLASGQVYRFELNAPEVGVSESFAFQTRQDFRVLSTLPAHQGTGVPVNTGVEIRFSAPDFEGVAERFTLVPMAAGLAGEPVTGRWETRGDTAAFVPAQTLTPGTLYQGTLKAGVRQTAAEQEVESDTVFLFQTAFGVKPDQNRRLYLADTLVGVTTVQVPVLPVYCDDQTAEAEFAVSVWRYSSVKQFKEALALDAQTPWWTERDAQRMPVTEGLLQQANLTTRLLQEDYERLLVLPNALAEGWYVVLCRVGDMSDYAFIQVQDMTLYMSVSEANALVWMHDGVTGESLPGVSLTTDAGPSATTDADGVALLSGTLYSPDGKPIRNMFDNPVGETTQLFLSAFRPGHSELVVPIASPDSGYRYDYRYEYGYWGPDWYRDIQLRNWHYLFTDRAVYLPTDTLSFWGVVQPRDGGLPPASLTVSLMKNDGWSNDDGWVLQTQTIPTASGGVYTGAFSFENFETGGYSLVVRDGDTVTDRMYVSLSRYEKPLYVLNAEMEQKVRMPGETVSVSLTGQFFEGTPVPGLALETGFYYGYSTIGETVVQLDAQGRAQAQTVVPELNGEQSWMPRNGSFSARTRDPEEADNAQYATFTVFPRDIMTWLTASVDKAQLTFSVQAHRLDKAAARKADVNPYSPDPLELPYLGVALDHPFEISLYEHYWDHKIVGKGYDPVNKVTYDRYEYFEVDQKIATYSGTTLQGLFKQQVTIPGWQKDRTYRLELRCVDESGRPIMESLYPDGTWFAYGYGYGGMADYGLQATKTDGGYRADETVTVALSKNGIPVKAVDAGEQVLYLLAREGHLSWEVRTEGTWQFPFQEAWIPNATAKAILWNGSGIRETGIVTLPYDKTEQALQISLDTDTQTYRPGQEVRVGVKVLDASGNPVQAAVNLSVVDEAYFALYPQEVDPLAALYDPVFWSGILYTAVSNDTDMAPPVGGGAEGGEGDDSGTPVRKAFRDTAWFGSLETDASGQGNASFVLPDNLTTFRLTAQAATASLQAGHAVGKTITKLPFFVQPVLQSVFLVGDAPTLLLRAYGDGVTQPETAYDVTMVMEDGSRREWQASGANGTYTSVSLGTLPKGTAVLTIRASNGKLTDAVERTLQVEENLLTTMRTLTFPVENGKRVPAEVMQAFSGKSPVSLTVVNRQGGLVQQVLWRLYGGSSLRVDRVLGRQMAAEVLRDVFAEPFVTSVPDEDFSLWQQADGGVALLPYGASDTLLSAKLCSVAVDRFDMTELRRYFKAISADVTAVPERAASALWGRAALGDPVLLEIRSMLSDETWEDKELLIFGLALADLGDRGGAEAILDALLAEFGREAAPLRWLELGEEREAMLRHTALAAMLAQKTGRMEAEALFRYVMENETRFVPLPLEQLSLLEADFTPAVATAEATIDIGGEKRQITVAAGATERFHLTADQLPDVRFESVTGELEVLAISRTGTDQLPVAKDPTVSIERRHLVEGRQTNTFNPTDAVEIALTVTFSEDAPKGGYSLSDLLPAGLRFTGGVYSTGDAWCWWQPDGREIRTALYHRGGTSVRTLRYRARVSGAGTFSADAPVIRHDDSDAGGVGTKANLTVKAP